MPLFQYPFNWSRFWSLRGNLWDLGLPVNIFFCVVGIWGTSTATPFHLQKSLKPISSKVAWGTYSSRVLLDLLWLGLYLISESVWEKSSAKWIHFKISVPIHPNGCQGMVLNKNVNLTVALEENLGSLESLWNYPLGMVNVRTISDGNPSNNGWDFQSRLIVSGGPTCQQTDITT